MVMESARGAYVTALRPRTDLQTESWRLLREEWAADPSAQTEWEEWERRRVRVRPQMLALLERFIAGGIGLEHFRATFDRRTRTDWDAFALKGSSGAMFLNALAKHAAHPVTLARRLRATLRAPADPAAAGSRLDEFIAAVAPPSLLGEPADGDGHPHADPPSQPMRAVFFASMCWHLQDPDRWPGFHPSARRVLHEEEELFTPTGEPVRDYLLFRESFLSLAAALSLTVWQLEHLCWWHARRSGEQLDDAPLFGDRPARRIPVSREPRSSSRSTTSRPRPDRPARTPAHLVR